MQPGGIMRNDRKRDIRRLSCALALFCASGALPSAPAGKKAEEPPVARIAPVKDVAAFKQDKVELTVRPDAERKKYLPNHQLFVAEGNNTGTEPVTINAVIELTPKPGRKSAGPVACLIYLELPAGEKRTVPVSCKLDGELGRWQLIVRRVWEFIL